MTRITSIGWKRTYVEAGFDHTALNEPVGAIQETGSNNAKTGESSNGNAVPPPKKKRKRTPKSKRDNYGAGPKEGIKEDEGASGQQREGGEDEGEPQVQAKKAKKKAKSKLSGAEWRAKEATSRAMQSALRRQKRAEERQASTTCFACRAKGHAARDCPVTNTYQGEKSKAESTVGICYRCGSPKHTLARCKKTADPSNPLPFASCFVCSGKGHLASSCPQNKAKGIYPDGGCCKLCGDTTHLAKNCGIRKSEETGTSILLGIAREAGADEDDFHAFKRLTAEVTKDDKQENKAKRMINTHSGVKPLRKPPVASTKKVVYF